MSPETAAMRDLSSGLGRVHAWALLAWDDVRGRYRRTTLGPLWLTLSHALFVVGLAISFSIILGQELGEYFVYLAAGMTVWIFIANSLIEGPAIFQRAQNLLYSYDLPASIHIFRAVLGQLITFAHHMLVYLGALIFVSNVTNVHTLWAIPALLVLVVAATGWSMILAFLGARFRDLAPAVAAVTQMMFLLTPIFWERSHLDHAQWFALMNPFYHLIEVLRAPLLGRPPDPLNWAVAIGIAVTLAALGALVYIKSRRNLSYWL